MGPIVSSDIFYQPDAGLAGRWSERGILAVEMEAAVLFTLGALRKIQAGCMLIVSDVVVEGEFVRITDEEMRSAVDEMTELALHTVTRRRRAGRPDGAVERTVFLVNPASANGSTGRRWPELARRAASAGLEGDTLFSERPGHLGELTREAALGGPSCSSWSAATGRSTRS